MTLLTLSLQNGFSMCCMCGATIQPNPANMCVSCIRNQVDITEGIQKQIHINFCRGCGRYLTPPNHWTVCELESRELLSLCVKRVKGINKVKLVDANFVYTEPHSRRLKVKLTIQKEVFAGTILQQAFIVEYTVMNQQCTECERFEAKDTWNAVVQVRQKTDHKKTFFYLEQLILRHNAHSYCSKLKEMTDGLDFYFSSKQHAKKFTEFLQVVVPIRSGLSESLISSDIRSNTANYKFSFSVEIIPICRDDLVCLPPPLVKKLGGIEPLYLCYKVTNSLHLIDPTTLKSECLSNHKIFKNFFPNPFFSAALVISAPLYWNFPFKSINTRKDFVEFMVLDVRPKGPKVGKFTLAEVEVAKVDDMGCNNNTYFGYTHIGHLLDCGSRVFGYLTESSVYNDNDLTSLKGKSLPSFVLVQKSYPKRRKQKKARYWKLKSLAKEEDQLLRKAEAKKKETEYEEFLNELEEDPEMRQEINLYKAENAEEIIKERAQEPNEDMKDSDEEDEGDGEDEKDFPEVKIEELLEDLNLNK